MLSIHENARGIVFKVFVQPRSSKNMIAGLQGDALKIKLKAPPVDGAANKMCIEYLAKCLNLPKSSFEIISGYTSRTKRLLVRFTSQNSTSKTETEQLKRSILALLNP
jgi:hypothetical protein